MEESESIERGNAPPSSTGDVFQNISHTSPPLSYRSTSFSLPSVSRSEPPNQLASATSPKPIRQTNVTNASSSGVFSKSLSPSLSLSLSPLHSLKDVEPLRENQRNSPSLRLSGASPSLKTTKSDPSLPTTQPKARRRKFSPPTMSSSEKKRKGEIAKLEKEEKSESKKTGRSQKRYFFPLPYFSLPIFPIALLLSQFEA